MAKAARPRTSRRRLSLLLTLIGLVGCYLCYSFLSLSLANYQIGRELGQYQAKKEALIKEREQLKAEVGKLQSDYYIERVAREELGWIKPGEVVILHAQPGEALPLQPVKGQVFGD